MKKFIEKMARFMYGRYGGDQLGQFMMYLACALVIITFILGWIPVTAVQIIAWVLRVMELLIIIMAICRFLSKKVHQRMAENRKFLAQKRKVVNFFKLRKDMYRDRKTHIYKKCPGCKTVLRLPKRPGEHTVKCGKCGHRFGVKVK